MTRGDSFLPSFFSTNLLFKMRTFNRIALKAALAGGLALAASCQQSGQETDVPARPVADPNNAGITLPEGFGAVAVVDSIGRARHLAINENGDIFVRIGSLRGEDKGGVVVLRDTTADGKADVVNRFDTGVGTGIEFYKGFLYVSTDTSIHRYKMDPSGLNPAGEPEIIVSHVKGERQHGAKPFAFDGLGNMFVTVGAPSNACQEKDRTAGSPGMDPCPILEMHGGIWKFQAEKTGQTQAQDGQRFATGIRHAVALTWNTSAKQLYAVQHGRDMLFQFFPQYYTEEQGAELPAEEFLLVKEGQDYGWPYCYYDPFQKAKMLAPEYGGDGKMTERCADKDQPIMVFPGHWGPNDLMFYTGDQFPARYKNGAFIAFHGSWNRAPLPQKGYVVMFVPFEGERPSGEPELFAAGFTGTDTLMSPGDAVYRPMGLAQGPDGSLYISDSRKGKIWRVMYYGQESKTAAVSR